MDTTAQQRAQEEEQRLEDERLRIEDERRRAEEVRVNLLCLFSHNNLLKRLLYVRVIGEILHLNPLLFKLYCKVLSDKKWR